MFHSSSARWLAVFPAMVALAAVAQPAPTPPPAPTSAGSAATAAPPPVLTFKSALEGYQSFADEKPIPWKEANETVYRRGGWQAYAKEASGTGTAEAESPKGAAAAPATQPGHSMPMPAKKEKP
ncbi:hypothetical protein ACCC97_01790 [Variovorax sp. Varisp85]|uniref:hypothetical protein n=1 Tax=unclassified Variovorax TaxID=663243 RepID=UPI0012F91C3D|nr:hypothetical protein [Variovorax sp. CF313]